MARRTHVFQKADRYTVFSKSDFDDPIAYQFLGGKLLAYSRSSPDKTTENEDCIAFIAVSETSGVILLADGLGGHPGGENASALIANIFAKNLRASGADKMRETILNSIDESNGLLLKEGNGSATTLCVLEIQDKVVRPYYIGDSTILIISQRGRIKFQTIAHSPVGYALEAGLIEEDEAIEHEERHIVYNVVGSSAMKIDIGPALTLSSKDRVIISSDGLTDNLLTDDIIDITRKGLMHKAASTLLSRCQSNMRADDGHPDDLSFALFSLT